MTLSGSAFRGWAGRPWHAVFVPRLRSLPFALPSQRLLVLRSNYLCARCAHCVREIQGLSTGRGGVETGLALDAADVRDDTGRVNVALIRARIDEDTFRPFVVVTSSRHKYPVPHSDF